VALERLGESGAFGEEIVAIIERQGWIVERRRAFAGEGILLIATLGELEECASGPCVSSAAVSLFHKVVVFFGTAYEHEQLQLRLA
jgi:hypothetical protein